MEQKSLLHSKADTVIQSYTPHNYLQLSFNTFYKMPLAINKHHITSFNFQSHDAT